MQHDTETPQLELTDEPEDFSGDEPQNVHVTVVDPAPTGDFSQPMRLGDFGNDLAPENIPPSWVKLGAKPTTLRILYRMPVPEDSRPGNDKDRIGVYARFKVEYHGTGEERVWDVSSKKLLARLGGIPNLRDWFHVMRTGSGANTIYEVLPGIAPKGR